MGRWWRIEPLVGARERKEKGDEVGWGRRCVCGFDANIPYTSYSHVRCV